jgi:hypothetical protein
LESHRGESNSRHPRLFDEETAMKRARYFWAVMSIGILTAIGSPAGNGQAVPAPVFPVPVPADLNPLVTRMADQVRRLGEAVATDLKSTPRGKTLVDESKELARAMAEYRDSVPGRTDRFLARRAYSGVDLSWHRLASDLSRPGSSSPAVAREAKRVAETDAMIHRALAQNDLPQAYYASDQPPARMADVQRLVLALVDRGEALEAVVRADMAEPVPGGGKIARDAVNLAQGADIFHDALDLNGRVDGAVQNGFSGVLSMSDDLAGDFARTPPTPRVRAGWQAYRSAEALVRFALGLPVPGDQRPGTFFDTTPSGRVSPVNVLADQLVQQVTAFLPVYKASAGSVPEGELILTDARALQAAATDFRRDTALGLDPGRLAFEFRDVNAIWQRLARRANRIARGPAGPNVQEFGKIGQTVAEIHRLLGVPGFAPVIASGP